MDGLVHMIFSSFQGEKVFSEPAVNHLPGCQLFQLVTRDWQIPLAYFKGNLG